MLRAAAPILVFALALAAPARAQDEDTPGTLSVVGEGKVEVAPTRARLYVTVTTGGDRLDTTQARHGERLVKARAAVAEIERTGVLKVQALGYTLRTPPPLGARGGPYSGDPFTAVSTFTLDIPDPARLPDVVSSLAKSGAVEIARADFGVADDRVPREQARLAAVADALAQGAAISEAAGVKLERIVVIGEPQLIARGAAMAMAMAMADMPSPAGAGAITVVPPATLTYSAQVKVRWRIAPR